MSAEIQYNITGASNFMYHSASQAFSSLIHTESHQRCVRTQQGRAVGGLTSLTHQDPLYVTQLCSSLCSRWCLNAGGMTGSRSMTQTGAKTAASEV